MENANTVKSFEVLPTRKSPSAALVPTGPLQKTLIGVQNLLNCKYWKTILGHCETQDFERWRGAFGENTE